MPTPIQSSSITKKLRSVFRLRGRQIFTLDETAVPTVAVQDLTHAPYRSNDQVRWKVGQRFATAIIPARNFMVIINLSNVAFMNLARVPGVAVIEKLEVQYNGPAAPDGTRDWVASLVNHTGILASVEPGAVINATATDVDAAFTVPVPAMGVGGQVPIRLSGVQENIAPALGVLMQLGRFRVANDPVLLPVGMPPQQCLPCEEITIGDNVALLIRNATAATTGTFLVNVSGTYYPLARS